MKYYLILYNLISSLSWTWTHIQCLQLFHTNVYPLIWNQVAIVQTCAILEILHAALGLVKSSVSTNIIQMGTRLLIVWFICYYLDNVQVTSHVAYTYMVLAWSLSVVIRFTFYNIGLMGYSSKWMTWARYSFFLILYPIGAFGEVVLIYTGLDSIHSLSKWMYYGFIILLGIYPFGFAYMYGHMLSQRKKYLGKSFKKKLK